MIYDVRFTIYDLVCHNTRLLNHKGSKLPHKELRVTHAVQRTQFHFLHTNSTNFSKTLINGDYTN